MSVITRSPLQILADEVRGTNDRLEVGQQVDACRAIAWQVASSFVVYLMENTDEDERDNATVNEKLAEFVHSVRADSL